MKNIVLIVIGLMAIALRAQVNIAQPSVSVAGEGVVKVIPNQVVINVRVESQGKSAVEVKSQNDKATDAVLKFCKQMKIDKKDIKTEYLNLNKNYDYQAKKYNYVANQSLSILLTNLDNYTALIEGLLDSGINRIDGVDFKTSEMDKYKAEARIRSVKDAKQKAQDYAGVLNQAIGKAIYISEKMDISSPIPMFKSMAAMEDGERSSSFETISVGELLIKATITVIFELK
jgi:uncharacterized protein